MFLFFGRFDVVVSFFFKDFYYLVEVLWRFLDGNLILKLLSVEVGFCFWGVGVCDIVGFCICEGVGLWDCVRVFCWLIFCVGEFFGVEVLVCVVDVIFCVDFCICVCCIDVLFVCCVGCLGLVCFIVIVGFDLL